jgi:zinc transport system substrate-binding protein
MSSGTRSVTRPRLLVGLSAAVLLLAGCGSSSGDEAGNGRSAVASFYPLAWVTERVAGDAFEVTNLTTPGGEPHDLELGIAETASLDGAEVVVYQEGFQPAVDEAVANVGEAEVVDAAAAVELRGVEEQHEAHEDEAHMGDEAAEEDHEGHEHGDLDPHFWLDPLLMADLADEVASTLADVDPERAEEFEANAADLRADLERLDTAYADGLATCERDTAVVSHDAFGYLERYGVHFEPIAGLSPGAEPTPADLGRLQELIREEGVTTVFSERLASPAMARTLAQDMGVETAVLDPIEGLTDETSGSDYVSLMEDNLAVLQEAGGC